MKGIQFNINFGGFYCSIYSEIIDSIIASEIEEGYIKNDDDINYNHLYKSVSEKILENIEYNYLDYNLDFIGLSSPKYYNYTTDKIIASINEEDYNEVSKKFLSDKLFISYANETSKSYDGFISFYNGIEEIKKEPSILMEYIFNFIINNEDDFVYYASEDINEVVYSNL